MTSNATLHRETGRLERRKARTRAAILFAANELFLKHGYEDTSIQQIAELAASGVGTLYGYFASKDEVLHEVLRAHGLVAIENYRASIDSTTPAIERVNRGLAEYRRYIQGNRKLITAAFYVSTRDGRMLEEWNDWLLQAYARMIRDGIDSHEFKPVPVESAARMLLNVNANAVLGIGIWRGVYDESITGNELEQLCRALLLA